MQIKKYLLGFALLSTFFVTQQTTAETVRIKVATLAPRGSMYHRVLQEIGEEWRNAQGPGAKFIVYPDGSQGGERDVVRRMQIGQINAALMSVVGLSDIDPSVKSMQTLPMTFRSWDEVDYVGKVLRPYVEKRFAAKGYKTLLWTEAGWVRFFTKEPAHHPDDLKSRRLFAWAGDNDHVEMTRALGYRPIVLETEDIIPGLQTGLIDTVPVAAMWALATQIDRLAPYMVDLKWAPIVGALVVNTKTWNKLSPAGQTALLKASTEASKKLRVHQKQAEEQAVAAMVKRGLQVQSLTPEQRGAWQRLADSAMPMIRGRTVPADVFDEVMRLLSEYRAKQNPKQAVHP